MVRIISIAENRELAMSIEEVTETRNYQIDWVGSAADLVETIRPNEASIVLLPTSASYDVYHVCKSIIEQYPLTSPILLFNSEEELDMKRALRAGAVDVIFLSSPIRKIDEELHDAVVNYEYKVTKKPSGNTTRNGRVITIASTKGGVGKTTIAVNLAVSYAKKLAKVAIIDLDLQFGDVAMLFDCLPKRSIYDWVKEDPQGQNISKYLTNYKDGIAILAAPHRPEFAEVITSGDIKRAIITLKKEFDVVIIDTSSYMDDNVITAMENANDILIMTYLDLPTLKNSKKLMDTLSTLKLSDRARIVLNRQAKVKGIKASMVEKVIGKEIFSILPNNEKVMVHSVNTGLPIGYVNPRSPIAKGIFRMAETISDPSNKPIKKLGKKKRKVKQPIHAGGDV